MRIARRSPSLGLSILVLAAVAGPAGAAWGPVQTLGEGVNRPPVIGFSQTGAAALAFETGLQQTYLSSHALGGEFSAPQQVATGVGPDQVVVAADGTTVLRAGSTVLVEAPGAMSFAPAQELGGAPAFDEPGPDAVIVPTARSEVVASVQSAAQHQEADVLSPGSTSLTPLGGLQGFSPLGEPDPIAADDAGGVFLTDQASESRCQKAGERNIVVAYRAAGGSFTTTTPLRCQTLDAPTVLPSEIAAAASAHAALVTVTGRLGHYQVVVQTRTRKRFGAAHVLARTTRPPNLLGAPVIGLGGRVTIGWAVCRRAGSGCSVGAASGRIGASTWHTRTFAAPADRNGVGGQVNNGFVTLSKCSGYCTLSVAYAGPRGFGSPQPLATSSQLVSIDRLITATGGRNRPKLVVWTTSSGQLFAAMMNATTRRLGDPQELAATGVANPSQVNDEVGPNGQAIVAWATSAGAADAVVSSGGG
jgi:hypothetical protein